MQYVMYDKNDIIVCSKEHVESNRKAGMKVFGRSDSEFEIQRMIEKLERM